ncbi:MAG TPA: helix-turn-helix domain-containing protein [Gemmataceae bacterium]|nr:helix-turn-helix domain-containing protein [Gemmataceae bacterium]
MIAAGKAAAKKLAHARILPRADQADGRPARTGEQIAEAVGVSTDTAARVRQRFVGHGPEAARVRKKQDRPSRGRVLDGGAEAELIAIACSEPPDERKAWTLRMLADKLVELEVVESVSPETVRRAMKKTLSGRT